MGIHWMCFLSGLRRFDVFLLHTNRHADTLSEAFQLVAHQMLQKMVRPGSNCPRCLFCIETTPVKMDLISHLLFVTKGLKNGLPYGKIPLLAL